LEILSHPKNKWKLFGYDENSELFKTCVKDKEERLEDEKSKFELDEVYKKTQNRISYSNSSTIKKNSTTGIFVSNQEQEPEIFKKK